MKSFSARRFWASRLGSVAVALAGLAVLQLLLVPHLNTYDIRLLVLAMLFASLAVSLNLINGITGQFSMGHAGFYAIGAYTSGKITTSFYDKVGIQDSLWIILVAVAGAVWAARARGAAG
jgi:branched-chain amino acid transport system permease protein